MENQPKTNAKNWLQRLKEESWEAELLVSVASIFAIFKAFALLDWLVDFFIDYLTPTQYFYGYMICFLGYVAFGVLGSFFVIHFGLRAYWIGLVGLNSVFPDYSIKDSAYSEVYTEKMSKKLPKLPTTINSLDEVCSVIFSAAFTLLLVYTYLGVISSVFLLIFNILNDYVPTFVLLIPLAIIAVMYLAMALWSILANIKKFKSNHKIQTWYYRIVIWGSKIFYGPLYKYILQITMVFGSNFKKKKALVKAVIFMIVFGFVLGIYQIFQSNVMYLLRSDSQTDESKLYSQNYQVNNENSFLLAPEIQSEIISEKAINIFIPILDHETTIMSEICGNSNEDINFNDDPAIQKRWRKNLACYASKIKIQLNEEIISVDFLKTYHPKTNQFGLRGFITIEELPSGMHRLKITKEVSSEIEKNWKIPFYKSSK